MKHLLPECFVTTKAISGYLVVLSIAAELLLSRWYVEFVGYGDGEDRLPPIMDSGTKIIFATLSAFTFTSVAYWTCVSLTERREQSGAKGGLCSIARLDGSWWYPFAGIRRGLLYMAMVCALFVWMVYKWHADFGGNSESMGPPGLLFVYCTYGFMQWITISVCYWGMSILVYDESARKEQ